MEINEKYELTLMVAGSATAAKKKSVNQLIEKTVKVFGGKITKNEDWGELELAYQIEKRKTGVFLHFVLELGKASAKTLTQKLNLENDVLRYLLVKQEGKKVKGRK